MGTTKVVTVTAADKPGDVLAAQGDICFMLIAKGQRPSNAKPLQPVGGRYIVAHSESGHNHVLKTDYGTVYVDTSDPFSSYVELNDGRTGSMVEDEDEEDTRELVFEHEKSGPEAHDTLKIAGIPEGFEVVIRRQINPMLRQAVQD